MQRTLLALTETNFLRHISHELKPPPTTLREGSELLLESPGDDWPEETEIAGLMCENECHRSSEIAIDIGLYRTD